MFKEHLTNERPVCRNVFVQTLRLDWTMSKWQEAWLVDWKAIGHDTDVIGYRAAGPLRTLWLRLCAKLSAER